MAKMIGLEIKVKRFDKTAYSAVRYIDGKAHNLEGIQITLPDGTIIPQLTLPESDPLQANYSTTRNHNARKARDRVKIAKKNNTTDANADEILRGYAARGKPAPTTYIYLGVPLPPAWKNGMGPARKK